MKGQMPAFTRFAVRSYAGTLALALCMQAFAGTFEVETEIIGPFTGHYAPLHPENLAPHPIRYYGTDLGWTYEHKGRIHFLFGDTAATEDNERIQLSTGGTFDDAFGYIELSEWPDPSRITRDNIPRIRLGQNPGTDEASAIDPGHAMEGFKTPVGGFSNGTHEFGLFYTSKPRACRSDADCGGTLSCDTGLGYAGEPWNADAGLTIPCLDGREGCEADTLKDAPGKGASGFCVDRSSTASGRTEAGRIASVALRNLFGTRSTEDPRRYLNTREWLTNRFSNPALRTVARFDPESGDADYTAARSGGGNARLFVWGRPGFIGVGAAGRPLGLYFAFADLPADDTFAPRFHYFAGVDESGRPQFTTDESRAAALDLDATRPGVQADEVHDVVDQMSVSWVEPLGKWVMFYGGGMVSAPWPPTLPACGILEFFTRGDCRKVLVGNGAIRMRVADHPWGPWSPPQDVLVGGDPAARPLRDQYAPGGILFHPECRGAKCVTQTRAAKEMPGDYGFLYAANIIEQWTRPLAGGAELIWNVSTWDPYRIVLVRTRISRRED